MTTRRDVLKAAGCAAALAIAGGARAADGAWPPYRRGPVIDGAGGLGLFFLEPGDPLVEKELQEVRASGVSSLVITAGPAGKFWLDDAAFDATRKRVEDWKATIARHPRTLMLVERAGDLERARADGKLGIIFGFQGTEPLGEDIERVPLFRAMGVRVIQLTHNRRNLVGDGAMEPGNAGLSNYGRQVVERLNAERVVVDLAHGSQRTIAEGIRASKAPVLISHAGCRALADLPRNVHDAELRAMADRGGVIGIIFWPYLRTDTQPMAIDVIRHIEHAIKVCGEDHVGLGTDASLGAIERTPQFERENREYVRELKAQGIFDPSRPDDLYMFIPDLNMPDRFLVLADMLSKRGHSDARIAKVLGGNFARVMREVWGD